MPVLLAILADDILPIFVVAAVGYMLARFVGAEVKTLSRVTFYALSPCLVFNMLTTSHLSMQEFSQMALFSAGMVFSLGLLGWMVLRPLRLKPALMTALLMTIMFSNAGNLGLPMVLFAFGTDALAHATIFFAVNAVLMYSVGVFMACSGQQGTRSALRSIVRVPAIYAVLAAGVVLLSNATVPAPLARSIELLSNAALPAMILVLGMQMERAGRIERLPLVGLATTIKLVAGPLLGLALGALLGLTGASRQAGIAQAGTPAAVLVTILALEYGLEPDIVTNVVFITTLLSPVTLTMLIAFLQ